MALPSLACAFLRPRLPVVERRIFFVGPVGSTTTGRARRVPTVLHVAGRCTPRRQRARRRRRRSLRAGVRRGGNEHGRYALVLDEHCQCALATCACWPVCHLAPRLARARTVDFTQRGAPSSPRQRARAHVDARAACRRRQAAARTRAAYWRSRRWRCCSDWCTCSGTQRVGSSQGTTASTKKRPHCAPRRTYQRSRHGRVVIVIVVVFFVFVVGKQWCPCAPPKGRRICHRHSRRAPTHAHHHILRPRTHKHALALALTRIFSVCFVFIFIVSSCSLVQERSARCAGCAHGPSFGQAGRKV